MNNNSNNNPKKKFHKNDNKPWYNKKKQKQITASIETSIGRPCDYETKVEPRLKEIEYWSLLGYTNLQISKALGIAESTFYEYSKMFSEFSESVNKYKHYSNIEVAKSLYERTKTQMVTETTEEIKESFSKNKETGIEEPLTDKYGNPVIQHITKVSTRYIPGDVNAMKFWLTNRDEENWKLKSEVKSDSTNKNLNVNANFDPTALSDRDLNEGLIELLNVISDT